MMLKWYSYVTNLLLVKIIGEVGNHNCGVRWNTRGRRRSMLAFLTQNTTCLTLNGTVLTYNRTAHGLWLTGKLNGDRPV